MNDSERQRRTKRSKTWAAWMDKEKSSLQMLRSPRRDSAAQTDRAPPSGRPPEIKERPEPRAGGILHHQRPPSLTPQPRLYQSDSNSHFPSPSTAQGARVPKARSTRRKRLLDFMVRGGVALMANPKSCYLFCQYWVWLHQNFLGPSQL